MEHVLHIPSNHYRCIDGDDWDDWDARDCERVNQQQMESKGQRCADCFLDKELEGNCLAWLQQASPSRP